MTLYESIIRILDYFGVFNIILPFILVYAIIYGILMRSKILGDPFSQNEQEAKAARTIISLVSAATAFLVVGSVNVVFSIKTVIPYFILYILILFMLILTISVFYLPTGKFDEIEYSKYRSKILIVAIIIFVIVTLNFFGLLSQNIGDIFSILAQYQEIVATIIIFAILIGAVYYITKSPSKEEKPQGKS